MKNVKLVTAAIVGLFLFSVFLIPTAVDTTSGGSTEIDNYIRNIQYDKESDISANTGCEDKPSYYNGEFSKTVTVKYVKQTAKSNSEGLLANSENIEGSTYPGALIKGTKNLGNNTPDQLVTKDRGDMKYYINLSGLSQSGFTVNPQNYSDVKDAITAKCNEWSTLGKSQACQVSYQTSEVSNRDQLKLELNLTAEQLEGLGIDLSWEQSNDTTTYVLKYTQIFYTVGVELPYYPSDYFGSTTTFTDVQNMIKDHQQALVVKSVSYGRVVEASVTSSESSSDIYAAISAAISGTTESLSVDQKSVLSSTDTKIYIYGGEIPSQMPTTIDEVISYIKNSDITPENVYTAKPIQYNAYWIDDSSLGVSKSTAEYTEKIVTETVSIDYSFRFNGAYEGESTLYYTTYDSIDPDTGKKVNEREADEYHGLYCADHTYHYTITAKHNPDMYLTVHAYGNDDACTKKHITPLEKIYFYHGGSICDQTFSLYIDDEQIV